MAIKQPAVPLPPGHKPTGGVEHKVGDKDSWWSLAKDHGVDAWWLIQYNFETKNPAEVNWYLKHRVGCKKMTADRQNYMFSSAASPGVIYVPSKPTVSALTSFDYKIYGISVKGGDEYRQRVQITLDWLARSDTGMILFKAIRRTGKPIEISAWEGSQCNATASSTNIRDATAAGEVVLRGGNSFEQLKEPSPLRDLLGLPKEPMLGTGAGSGATVKFSASIFGYGATGACSPFAGLPGASPSQVLFHELAHAYRFTNGTYNPRPTIGGSVSYTNVEEFFAVVLSNVLISDPTYSSGNRTLRADHAGFAPLAPALSTTTGFLNHTPNRNKMRELIASEPALAADLKRVRSTFNPFAVSP